MKSERYLKHIERLIRQRPSSGPSLRSYGELARLMIQAEPAHEQKTAKNKHLQINGKDGVPPFSRKTYLWICGSFLAFEPILQLLE